VEAVAAFVDQQGWGVPYNLNKYYTGFKMGNKVVFSVNWGGTYAWKVNLKLPREVAERFQGQDWEFQNYDQTFHNAIIRPLHPEAPDIKELEPLFIEAYRHISGTK
jgi:long-subunit fatty acid transport protein